MSISPVSDIAQGMCYVVPIIYSVVPLTYVVTGTTQKVLAWSRNWFASEETKEAIAKQSARGSKNIQKGIKFARGNLLSALALEMVLADLYLFMSTDQAPNIAQNVVREVRPWPFCSNTSAPPYVEEFLPREGFCPQIPYRYCDEMDISDMIPVENSVRSLTWIRTLLSLIRHYAPDGATAKILYAKVQELAQRILGRS